MNYLDWLDQTVAIRADIPVPPRYVCPLRDAISRMAIGESFILHEESQRTNLYQYARKLGVSITSRKINGKGYRIWRVEK